MLSLIIVRIVLDTSVFVAALMRASAGPSSRVVRLCLERRCQALMGDKLFCEFESVLSGASLFKNCPLSPEKRQDLFAGFANVCEWISVHYLWRPNLPDEGDNHVFELAIAGGARVIVTQNIRDFKRSELRFPEVEVLTPSEFLRKVV